MIIDKLNFINEVMNQLGYPINYANYKEEIPDGLRGYKNKKNKHISFTDAQHLVKTMLYYLKKSNATKFNFHNNNIILTKSELAEIVVGCLYLTDTEYLIMGDYKSIIYSRRAKHIKDQSTGEVFHLC